MVSRDTRVQFAAVVLAIGALLTAGYADVPLDDENGIVFAVAVYGVALGGAHLYLAVRHDDGLVPVQSRWRYVGALTVVLLSATAIALVGGSAVGPLSVRTIALGVIALTALGYLVTESRAGYLASRT
ncbi:hypothetical protein [Halovivax cerinus]|uniref:Uncharacterized protein n=1 Tax=Halovivax cerinus TaxID=1487865 RepID=A0ABD5NI56_9EURY|nr:hypothetical protein [Halovivax cerinus]